jgi:hypothetical protein
MEETHNTETSQIVPPLGNPLASTTPETAVTQPVTTEVQVASPVINPAPVTAAESTISPIKVSDEVPATSQANTTTSSATPPATSAIPPLQNQPLNNIPPSNSGVTGAPSSSKFGIIFGIVLLISLVVGGSTYYYFYIYKVANMPPAPAPVTLIKKERVPLIVVATTTQVVPPVDESIALDDEITNAEAGTGVSDTLTTSFTDQVK